MDAEKAVVRPKKEGTSGSVSEKVYPCPEPKLICHCLEPAKKICYCLSDEAARLNAAGKPILKRRVHWEDECFKIAIGRFRECERPDEKGDQFCEETCYRSYCSECFDPVLELSKEEAPARASPTGLRVRGRRVRAAMEGHRDVCYIGKFCPLCALAGQISGGLVG